MASATQSLLPLHTGPCSVSCVAVVLAVVNFISASRLKIILFYLRSMLMSSLFWLYHFIPRHRKC